MDLNIQLTQFLMGLNDAYTGVRGHILMMKPLPSLNQSYAILLQEESQRESHSYQHHTTVGNLAMNVKSTNQGRFQHKPMQINKKGSLIPHH